MAERILALIGIGIGIASVPLLDGDATFAIFIIGASIAGVIGNEFEF